MHPLRSICTGSLLALVALHWSADCTRETGPAPNVLIVSIDTLNRSALRIYDAAAPELENLDDFAAAAAVFERAYTTSSWTLPAHASLMTGLYPTRHGATHELLGIDPAAAMLPERLLAQGYETVGFTDGGFVDGAFGFGRGFERLDDFTGDAPGEQLELPRDGHFTPLPGSALFDRAIAFLRQRDPSRPFFAFVHTYSVHDYFQVHPWAARRFAGRRFQNGKYYEECLDGTRPDSAEDWNALRDLYRAELLHLDRGFGRLLAELRAQGLERTTVVMLVSDHGEGFEPEAGRIHHGGRLEADVIRIPWLASGPGIPAERHQVEVSLVDVLPTVLDFAGARAPAGLDGRSLAPTLRGTGSLAARPIFAVEHGYLWTGGRRISTRVVRRTPISVAVIAGKHWYVRGPADQEHVYRRGSNDLEDPDPGELAGLRRLADELGREPAPLNWHSGDEELGQRLRALGYVER